LEELWRQRPITQSPSDTNWAAKQCFGIARALKRIHGLSTWQKKKREGSPNDDYKEWGRHGDIKPNNILWFSSYESHRDLLVLSDLGLTRYHSEDTRSVIPRSRIDGCTWQYRPPEWDLEENISQKYDIWSLGCVYLEFCVWYLLGHDAVLRFGDERSLEDVPQFAKIDEDKFFNTYRDQSGNIVEQRVNPVVKKVRKHVQALLHAVPTGRERC
jgi:serine/threonine protein kinase